MSTRPVLLCFLLILLFSPACKKQDEIRIKLTPRENSLLDTMCLERLQVLRPIWDSICLATHESLLEIVMDSIIKVRRAEEIKLRSRIVLPEN